MVTAYVNHSRWVCDCPNCNSGILIKDFGERERYFRVFTCGNCKIMTSFIMPDNVGKIESVLLSRPIDTNRNWLPGESIEKLWQENYLHGVTQDCEIP